MLVIDDIRMMRLYLCRSLERAGFEAEEWMPLSATEIPDRIAASTPDLVLSDYQMAGCSGATVIRMVKKANPRIPVMIITAFHDEEMEHNLLKLGVKRILYKPISADELAQAVREVLKDAAVGA